MSLVADLNFEHRARQQRFANAAIPAPVQFRPAKILPMPSPVIAKIDDPVEPVENKIPVEIQKVVLTVDRCGEFVNMFEPWAAKEIIRQCAAEIGLTGIELVSQHRFRLQVAMRQKAMWLIRQHLAWSFPHMCRHFNRTDHTTILHGVNQFQAKNPGFCAEWREKWGISKK